MAQLARKRADRRAERSRLKEKKKTNESQFEKFVVIGIDN